MNTEIVYQGQIAERDYGEAMDVLFIGDSDEPFAKVFVDALEEHGWYVSVSYFISDEPRTEDELVENLLMALDGEADAEYVDRYSDITGYLWTDQELNVGGHDLLSEIESYIGKWLFMKVRFDHSLPTRSAEASGSAVP